MGRRSAHYYRRFSGWGLATFFALRTFIMDSLLRICTVSTQHFGDSLRRLHFGMKVEVTIKIGCNIKCWMSEPLLDRLHGYSVCKQQTGTWMTKIMESNVFELIFLNDVLEVRSHKVWRDQLTEVVTANKAVIFPVKVFTEKLRVVFFKSFTFDQHLFNMRNQGKGSYTGQQWYSSRLSSWG